MRGTSLLGFVACLAGLGALLLVARPGEPDQADPPFSAEPPKRAHDAAPNRDRAVAPRPRRPGARSPRAGGQRRPGGARRGDRGGIAAERELDALGEHAAGAERALRRFWGYFARYEIGELGEGVRAGIRRTATPDLARELLRNPPRVPRGAGRPAAARLGELRVRGGAVERRRPRYRWVEIVAAIRRPGQRRSQLGFRVRARGQGWRVGEIGG